MRWLGTSIDRDVKESLLKYLPSVYKGSKVVDGVLTADAIELEKLYAAISTVLDQFFVSTSTEETIAQWEKLLDLPSSKSKSLELRRKKVLEKLIGRDQITLKSLTELINLYVENSDSYITENYSLYSFTINVPLAGDIDLIEIVKLVNELKPAHLAFDLTGVLNDNVKIKERVYSFSTTYRVTNTFYCGAQNNKYNGYLV
jgi:hypothetical protein